MHLATVSRALRNDPQIGQVTALEVRRVAQEMGYQPDPMLTALSSYRSQIKKPEYHATIAWLSNSSTRDGWNNCTTFDLYFQGARERASQLGYKLEVFWLREPGMTPKRATSILRSRGISGLIVAPQPTPKMGVRLDWDYFSAVALGHTTAWPQLHIVTNDQFHSMATAIQRVRAHGYSRIGLAVHHRGDGRSGHRWTGAFLAQKQYWPVKNQIPILSIEGITQAKLRDWLKKYRPDAVISYVAMVKGLRELGYQIPGDLGFATFGGSPEEESQFIAGIDENASLTGYAAVDRVVGMIQHGERGIPKVPQCLLVEGTWREGETLRYQNHLEVLTGMD